MAIIKIIVGIVSHFSAFKSFVNEESGFIFVPRSITYTILKTIFSLTSDPHLFLFLINC